MRSCPATLRAFLLPILLAIMVLQWAGGTQDLSPHRNSFPFEIQSGNAYVGYKVCAACHPLIAKEHESSNHAQTWSRVEGSPFSRDSRLSSVEGPPPPVVHQVLPGPEGLSYQVRLPSGEKSMIPVHSIVGGKRFGYSFLLEARDLNGVPLARPAVIEGRYMFRTNLERLSISPGLPAEKPVTFETAFGRVLSPSFAAKCLDCHGGLSERSAPIDAEHPVYKDTAVRCERCHGPGRLHVDAAQRKDEDLRILNPRKLDPVRQLMVCEQCHGGFKPVSNPRPQDLLISAQVVALRNTRCFEASEGRFSCLACHNPHRNAAHSDPAYEKACLSCHRSAMSRPSCPVSPHTGCIGCHMPVVRKPGSFELTDHWIRIVRRSP